MTFIHQCCNGWYCNYMSFIMFKVVILQDGTFYCLEIITIFQFDVNISSVDTGSKRNGHGQSITNALFALCRYRVTHAHARAKVCVGNTIWSTRFQKGTNYRVRSRIPAGRDNSNCTGCFCFFIQFTVQVPDLCMDIKTVYGIDSFARYFFAFSSTERVGRHSSATCGFTGSLSTSSTTQIPFSSFGCSPPAL